MLEYQTELEKMYAKVHAKSYLINKFSDTEFFNEIGIDPVLGAEVLSIMYKLKNIPFEVLFNILNVEYAGLYEELVVQIELLYDNNLIGIDLEKDSFYNLMVLTKKEEEELNRFQYPIPMILEPRILKCNTDSGYLTFNTSVILKDNHTENDVNLDHINCVNSIPLSLDRYVSINLKAQRRNIETRKKDESSFEFKKRKQEYSKYLDSNTHTLALLKNYTNKFYICSAYDKRGRVYRKGYHINPQGTDWHKASIEFYHKEKIDKE